MIVISSWVLIAIGVTYLGIELIKKGVKSWRLKRMMGRVCFLPIRDIKDINEEKKLIGVKGQVVSPPSVVEPIKGEKVVYYKLKVCEIMEKRDYRYYTDYELVFEEEKGDEFYIEDRSGKKVKVDPKGSELIFSRFVRSVSGSNISEDLYGYLEERWINTWSSSGTRKNFSCEEYYIPSGANIYVFGYPVFREDLKAEAEVDTMHYRHIDLKIPYFSSQGDKLILCDTNVERSQRGLILNVILYIGGGTLMIIFCLLLTIAMIFL